MNALRVFFGFHLSVLVLGLLPTEWWNPKVVTYFLAPYARITSAGASFGFFSPNVGNQLTVQFQVTRKDGRETPLVLEDSLPKEVSVRLGNMYRLIGEVYTNKKLRRSVLASLTTPVFRSDPSIRAVRVKVATYEVPGLLSWNRGARVRIRPIYTARFQRDTE